MTESELLILQKPNFILYLELENENENEEE